MTETPNPLEGIVLPADPEAALVVATPAAKALAIFTTPGAVDSLVGMIRAAATQGFTPDLTTDKGRKEVASRAFRVAKAKTALDDLGKDEVARLKELPKAVDAGRKALRDGLDALRDQIREPLTKWEEKREALKADLTRVQNGPAALYSAGAAQIRDAIAKLEALPTTADRWEELAGEAQAVKNVTLLTLQEMAEKAQKREDDAAELERLRQEKANRDKADREEQLRKEGEERARAQASAQNTTTPAATAPQASVSPAEPVEQGAATPGAQSVAQPAAHGGAVHAAPTDHSLEHRRTFNREALADLQAAIFQDRGQTALDLEPIAKAVLTAIVTGKVRHISITY